MQFLAGAQTRLGAEAEMMMQNTITPVMALNTTLRIISALQMEENSYRWNFLGLPEDRFSSRIVWSRN